MKTEQRKPARQLSELNFFEKLLNWWISMFISFIGLKLHKITIKLFDDKIASPYVA